MIFLVAFLAFLTESQAQYLPINWDTAQSNIFLPYEQYMNDSVTESPVLPVEYVSLSTCDCDRIADVCDFTCCCDLSCDTKQRTVMNCRNAVNPQQNQLSLPVPQCNILPHRDELFSILCVHDVQTSYLGHFLQPPPIIRQGQEYSQVLSQFNYATSPVSTPMDLPQRVSYSYAIPVQTGIYQGETLGSQFGWLSLPSSAVGISYACTFTPIEYLVSMDEVCSTIVTSESCINHQSLSVLSYLIPNPGSGEVSYRKASPRIVSSSGDSVIYLAADQIAVNYYQQKTASDVEIPSEGLPSENVPYIFWNFGVDSLYLKPKLSDNHEAFDLQASYRAPAPPYIQNDLCMNTVTSVSYTVVWNASTITSVQASIIVQSSPLNTAVDLTFKVTWEHRGSETEDTSTLAPQSLGAYSFGKPVVGATINSQTQEFMSSSLTQAYYLVTDSSNLCNTSTRSQITFGDSRVSACYITLMAGDFENCTSLAETVRKGLTNLVSATHISKVAVPLNDNPQYFVPIFRIADPNDEFAWFFRDSEDSNSSTSQCREIPQHIGLELIYSKSGEVNGEIVYEIVGASTYFNTSFLEFNHPTTNFMVSATVKFMEIPPISTRDRKLASLREGRERCPSAWCWHEMFYPFLQSSHRDKMYSLAMGLATAFIVVYLTMLLLYK